MERFFLVPVGRGHIQHMVSADEHERIFHWLYVCGGQRGRAYAITGDYLETDLACAYQPN